MFFISSSLLPLDSPISVEMIGPYQVRVDNPAMGTGGFFIGDNRQSGMRVMTRCRASARDVAQSKRYIEDHGGTIDDIMVFGQAQWGWDAHLRHTQYNLWVRFRRKQPNQCNLTTWRMTAMSMAIRDFDKELANTFTSRQHPDLSERKIMKSGD